MISVKEHRWCLPCQSHVHSPQGPDWDLLAQQAPATSSSENETWNMKKKTRPEQGSCAQNMTICLGTSKQAKSNKEHKAITKGTSCSELYAKLCQAASTSSGSQWRPFSCRRCLRCFCYLQRGQRSPPKQFTFRLIWLADWVRPCSILIVFYLKNPKAVWTCWHANDWTWWIPFIYCIAAEFCTIRNTSIWFVSLGVLQDGTKLFGNHVDANCISNRQVPSRDNQEIKTRLRGWHTQWVKQENK